MQACPCYQRPHPRQGRFGHRGRQGQHLRLLCTVACPCSAALGCPLSSSTRKSNEDAAACLAYIRKQKLRASLPSLTNEQIAAFIAADSGEVQHPPFVAAALPTTTFIMSGVNGPAPHAGGYQGHQPSSRDSFRDSRYQSYRLYRLYAHDCEGRRGRGGSDNWTARHKRYGEDEGAHDHGDSKCYDSHSAAPSVRFETPQSPPFVPLAPAPLPVESPVYTVPVADSQLSPRSVASIRKAYARFNTSVLMPLPLLPFDPRNSIYELVHLKAVLRSAVDACRV